MNSLQNIDIWETIAALEAAATGAGIDHEIWMLKQKLKSLENTQQ